MLVAEPPPAWSATTVAAIDPVGSVDASVTQWDAWRAPSGATFLLGCLATPIPGWVEDMRPPIEARTLALAGAAARRVTGAPVDARAAGPPSTFELRPAEDPNGPVLGRAHTFVGFDRDRVLTCFAICAAIDLPSDEQACGAAASHARLSGTAPPAPGIALRATTWAVHHPRAATLGGTSFAALASFLTIVTRRRPRSRV